MHSLAVLQPEHQWLYSNPSIKVEFQHAVSIMGFKRFSRWMRLDELLSQDDFKQGDIIVEKVATRA